MKRVYGYMENKALVQKSFRRRLAAKKGIPLVSPASIISKVLAAAENHGDGDEEEDNNTPASNFETKMLQALQNGKEISCRH